MSARTFPLLTFGEASSVLVAADPSKTCPTCDGEGRTYQLLQHYNVIVLGKLSIRERQWVWDGLKQADVIQWRPSEMHGWVLWVYAADHTAFGILGIAHDLEDFDA